MERIQGQNKLCSLDQKVNVRRSLEVRRSVEDQSFALAEDQLSTATLQDTRIPFLQMLQQSEDPSSFLPFKDPNFLALLSLQTLEKPWELENYLPHEVPEFHSPTYSETNHYPHNPSLEGVNEAISSQEFPLNSVNKANSRRKRKNNMATSITREKRKRRRTKPTKNVEEMETQRMTHIAVERNRRRQMNVHLNSLRSIIPPSYIQRGDQASIVGGAIDFVKILEQHLQSLEAQKITQQSDIKDDNNLRDISSNKSCAIKEEQRSKIKVEATVIESHVNLKIQCQRKQGQLLRSIILLEKLRFTVLHINIISPSNTSISYSFNLKMEDDCNLGSADEITAAVRQIFNG
ncbi:Transcription factor bHLH70 [Cardamine amara subsp. amara]|uniref:Transcription factor bHLH70 n=1 Tax=Cardamine amara subsp. amara TaxID=228776 RepID=A0ABD1A2F4_CARAN